MSNNNECGQPPLARSTDQVLAETVTQLAQLQANNELQCNTSVSQHSIASSTSNKSMFMLNEKVKEQEKSSKSVCFHSVTGQPGAERKITNGMLINCLCQLRKSWSPWE